MAIKILIAEDEDNIRLALKTIVRKNLVCDDIVVCEDGAQAWENVQTQHFSLVISDWNMPNKTGFELLQAMRENEATREVPFLLLTARSDKTSVINALQIGVSDYVTKPFDKEALIQKARKLLAKAPVNSDTHAVEAPANMSVADEVLRRLKTGVGALPVLPELANKVEALFQNEEVEINELVKLVQTDPGITTKLISISNSPQYRAFSEINTLDKAISRIGLKMTQNYVLVLSKRSLFKVDTPHYEALLNKIWQHSLATAACAQALAQHLHFKEADSYYTMGLLHDLGKLLLLQIFAEVSKKRPEASEAACMALMDEHHGEFGAALLSKWNFPMQHQQIARLHHAPQQADQYKQEIQLIALAHSLAVKTGYAVGTDETDEGAIQAQALKLGIEPAGIENAIRATQDYMQAQDLS